MKRWPASPIFLFFLGFCVALSPYLYWSMCEKDNPYVYEISYYPAWIWSIGFVSFSAGALIVKGGVRPNVVAGTSSTERENAKRVLLVLLLTYWIGTASVVGGVYGGIPLLGYIRGSVEVNEVNQVQTTALGGHLGFVLASCFALMMALVVYLRNLANFTAGHKVIAIAVIMSIVVNSTIAGKRQVLAMLVVELACLFSLSGASFRQTVSALMPFGLSGKVLGMIVAISFLYLVFYIFGFLAAVRTGLDPSSVSAIATGIDQVVLYLQLPLINFEVQTEVCGWGPGADNFWGPFLNLIPNGLQQSFILDQGLLELPPRAEPTIGSGFYELVHWFWGIKGIVVFSVLCGALCQWLYVKSASNSIALAVYCHFAWTLISAHMYNHFLLLVFGVIPVAIFLGTTLLIGGSNVLSYGFQAKRLG